ncbi:MAG: EAL domain-containing protein [Actinomycetia bacterium]|nr:EAL domain-containing protein [Actinomycetes bacterium]
MTLLRDLKMAAKLGVMLGAACAGLAAVAVMAVSSLSAIESDWNDFVASAQVRETAVVEMRSATGYGGMIHDFKNYVLRADDLYGERVREHGVNALAAMDVYRGVEDVNATESDSLDQVELMVESYLAALDTAELMFSEGAVTSEVDEAIKIDDSPFLDALAALSVELETAIEAETEAVSDRVASAQRRMVATIVPAVVALLLLGFVIVRMVVRGLARIGDQAETIAGGDLGAEPLNMSGRDEITKLGNVFDEMTRSLGLVRDQLRSISVLDTSSEVFAELVPGELGEVIEELAASSRARLELETELERRATRDPLTGLPNRRALQEMLEATAGSKRRPDLLTAALFLDLDNFKVVNDSLGHIAGDDLLKGIAHRVRSAIRADDTVGRLGGDEFLVLCPGVVSADEAITIAERIIDAVGPAFRVAGREVHATLSIGVALLNPGDSAEDLLAAADTAAYEAKAKGRNRAELFDTALRQRAHEQLNIVNSLKASLDTNDELVPFYQPIVSLDRLEVVGFEALCRWHHPQRGQLSAEAFIEIAEDHGLEVPISWSMMTDVTAQIARWVQDPSISHPPCINVNVSARQLRDPSFTTKVRQRIDDAGIDPSLLCVEVTEQTIISDLESAAATLNEVREFGVKVAIDDFGIGNSSLSYLRSLPIDVVKLDMSFVSAIEEGHDALTIITAVIRMTNALGHPIVAEGIETTEQMATLQALSCDRGQGFLFSPALAAEAATELLAGTRQLNTHPAHH